MNKKILFLITIIAVGFIAIKAFNYLQSEESKIKKIIMQGKRFAEIEDFLKCVSLLTMDFSDSYGNDRATLGIMANAIFKRYDDIKIAIKELEIEVDKDTAQASLNAVALGRNIQNEQLEYNTLKFNMTLIKKGNKWQVNSIEWLEPEAVFSPFMS